MARTRRIRFQYLLIHCLSLSIWVGAGIPCEHAILPLGNCHGATLPTERNSPAEQNNQSPAQTPEKKNAEPPLDDSIQVEPLLAARLSKEELRAGWIRLFDGQSLFGWKNAGNADWHVEDGAIVATKGETGLLVTNVRFSDFELELEFRAEERTNSGVFLRTPAIPKDPTKDCYELNIAPPDNPFPTGSYVGRAKANLADSFDSEEWHQMRAYVDGDQVRAWVDGTPTVEFVDKDGLKAGLIGLQFREGSVRFRNIRIRPITYQVLPKVKKSDWNEPMGEIRAEFLEDRLRILGGRGRMELLQQHANVCIQAEAKTLNANTNSGVFFRCIPGEDMNGYECQIHHGFKDDRRRPVDAGTGAIFRRQNARAVLTDSEEPVFVTIIADGNKFATWAQGIQVVDWEDTRKPDPNPRRGLRTEAGTIMLQGHDAESGVEFFGLSICPLP